MLNIIFVRTNACSQNSKGLMLRTTWSYSPIWEGAIIYLIWKKEHKIFSNIILFAVLQPRQKREFSLYPQQASIFNIQKRMSDTIDRNPTKYWSSLGSLAGTEEVELLIYKVGYTLPINRLCFFEKIQRTFHDGTCVHTIHLVYLIWSSLNYDGLLTWLYFIYWQDLLLRTWPVSNEFRNMSENVRIEL